MTPADLAARHERLFRVTAPGAYASIKRHGLLPASGLARLFTGAPQPWETHRRPAEIVLEHPLAGRAVISDNRPLNEAALAACLDDALTPPAWLAMLNARVFFWANEAGMQRLLEARTNRGRAREVLVIDTLSLAIAHAPAIDLSPINTGATLRHPARRGAATFTPMLTHSYDAWRRLRGRVDTIREVSVRDGVPDLARYVVEVRSIGPRL